MPHGLVISMEWFGDDRPTCLLVSVVVLPEKREAGRIRFTAQIERAGRASLAGFID
jgi:hypothetical protein